ERVACSIQHQQCERGIGRLMRAGEPGTHASTFPAYCDREARPVSVQCDVARRRVRLDVEYAARAVIARELSEQLPNVYLALADHGGNTRLEDPGFFGGNLFTRLTKV